MQCGIILISACKYSLLMKEVLLMLVTDSGSDHNISHASVQVALICLFMQLDLDMLVGMLPVAELDKFSRTQYVGTKFGFAKCERDEMVCRNNTLTKLQEAAQGNAALKEEYTSSMASVLRMNVKEQPIMCYPPADEQDISRFFYISRQIDLACGGSFFSDDHLMQHSCVTRRELACHVEIEPAYYSSNMK